MTASVGEKRKRPNGKVFEEPPVIPCTAEELNHVLDKWIRDGVVKPFTVSRPLTEEERKNPLFCRIHNYVKYSTKDCWTLRRLFHKKLREGTLKFTQKEPKVQRNPLPNHKVKGVVAVVIHGNPAEAKESEGSFHLSIVPKESQVHITIQPTGIWTRSKKGGHKVSNEYISRFGNGMFHNRITC